jgi:hypothetical protein
MAESLQDADLAEGNRPKMAAADVAGLSGVPSTRFPRNLRIARMVVAVAARLVEMDPQLVDMRRRQVSRHRDGALPLRAMRQLASICEQSVRLRSWLRRDLHRR